MVVLHRFVKACPAVMGQVTPTRRGGCHTAADAAWAPPRLGSAGVPGDSCVASRTHLHPATPSDLLPEAEPAQPCKITRNCCTTALLLNPPSAGRWPSSSQEHHQRTRWTWWLGLECHPQAETLAAPCATGKGILFWDPTVPSRQGGELPASNSAC